MTNITEIAPDLYRISVYVPEADMQFNHFLVRDDEPMLYHTGMRRMFPVVLEAVSRLLDPAQLRWIGFSHFEVDECGALNELAVLEPKTLAAMHGSTFVGDGAQALRDLAVVMREVYAEEVRL